MVKNMTNERLQEAIEQYDRIEKRELKYQKILQSKIADLQKKLAESRKKSPYQLIYSEDDGDYRVFVEELAVELRNRQTSQESISGVFI